MLEILLEKCIYVLHGVMISDVFLYVAAEMICRLGEERIKLPIFLVLGSSLIIPNVLLLKEDLNRLDEQRYKVDY